MVLRKQTSFLDRDPSLLIPIAMPSSKRKRANGNEKQVELELQQSAPKTQKRVKAAKSRRCWCTRDCGEVLTEATRNLHYARLKGREILKRQPSETADEDQQGPHANKLRSECEYS